MNSYDQYISDINLGKININDLDYETKINIMKRSYEIATKKEKYEEKVFSEEEFDIQLEKQCNKCNIKCDKLS